MAKKGKSRGNPLAELRFISSLSLDEVREMLKSLSPIEEDIIIKTGEGTPDEFTCSVHKPRALTLDATVLIKVRRWNHDETKIEATGGVLRDDDGELLSFRERDTVLQLLVDAFTSNRETHPL